MEVDQADPPAQIHVTTPSVSIQPVPEFNPDAEFGASLATRWNTWLADFEMFLVCTYKMCKNIHINYLQSVIK